jgi:hypothetical protein
MMEARLQSEEERGRVKDLDRAHLLTRLFEEVHEAREALSSGRDPSVAAASIGCIAMRIVESCGRFSSAAVRKGSMRTMNAMKEPLNDSSSRYAVVMNNRCVLWGSELETDFAISDATLMPVLPSIALAMKTLQDHRVKVGRIVVRAGMVRVFPEAGVDDPRTEAEAAPIPDTARID